MTATLELDHNIRIAPNGGRSQGLAVLLHGVGSSAMAMVSLGRAITDKVPGIAVVALDGPDPFDLGPQGRQWFSVAGVTEANRPARVASALPGLRAMIAREQERVGLPAERTALIGFSQGAIMALHLAGETRPPAVIVSLAGRLAAPLPLRNGPKPAILLSHGSADAVIAPEELECAAVELQRIGCVVETRIVPGHGHAVHAAQIRAAVDKVSGILQARKRAA